MPSPLTAFGIEPIEFGSTPLIDPSISPFQGDTWYLEVPNITGTLNLTENQDGFSGMYVGTPEPYVSYDQQGRPIVGEVIIVTNAPDKTFPLPQTPPGKEGFMLKVINNTQNQLQATFPSIFTYYGRAVYGEVYRLGGVIAPGEAGLYRAAFVDQGKIQWSWEGLSNRIIG